MAHTRPSLGFAEALEAMDLAAFAAKPTADRSEPDQVAAAARAAGFCSREGRTELAAPEQAGQAKTIGQQRRRRTGRTAQINLKAKPATIEAYCAIADQMGWGLGEAFEKAVELLQARYADHS